MPGVGGETLSLTNVWDKGTQRRQRRFATVGQLEDAARAARAARANPLDLAAQGRLVKKEAIAALAKQGHPCMFPSVVL